MVAALVAITFGSFGQAPEGLPLLSPVFQDHMVLQRDKLNTFWGWTAPGTRVSVTVGDHHANGVADKSGKWTVRLKPPPVGGPYTILVEGPKRIELNDILVGDVWLCCGQSNMEMGVAMAANGASEAAAANHPQIRLAMVPRDTQFDPRLTTPVNWSVCTPESIGRGGWAGFSAVGYFFGRELNKRLNIPIGLVEDCWGGTPVEAWISRPNLVKEGDFGAFLQRVDEAKNVQSAPYGKQIEGWLAQVDPGSKPAANWEAPDFDDQSWKAAPMPASYAALGLGTFPGVVWYRGSIDLPSTLPAGDATITLGAIGDIDTTWINGQRVGATYVYNRNRQYVVGSGVLRPGRNAIAVRVLATGGAGGFNWGPDSFSLRLADGSKVALATGSWRYATGANIFARPPIPQPLEGNPYEPLVLYNGMIAPIVPMAFKGALWYQGETNAGRAYQYRTLLPDMIRDWRTAWGEGEFPFLIVQLAAWQKRQEEPGDSDWAELREAQALTAEHVKNSGLATAVDIGDAVDIHPKDKQDVGLRLALVALHDTYGQRVTFAGPTYKSFRREGSAIRISFAHADGGLSAKDGALKGFAIAGPDHKFYWAQAEISGASVLVRCPEVSDPVAVRYGWANNPEVTLYNGAGLPAIPFRTDDWKGVTFGRK